MANVDFDTQRCFKGFTLSKKTTLDKTLEFERSFVEASWGFGLCFFSQGQVHNVR